MNVLLSTVSNSLQSKITLIMNTKYLFAVIVGLSLAACSSYAQESMTNFVGVGLALSVQNNSIRIVSVIANTSAADAHIQPGSYIKEVNGVSTDGMNIQECVDRIRGPETTTVALELADPANTTTNTVQLTREKITVPQPQESTPNPGP